MYTPPPSSSSTRVTTQRTPSFPHSWPRGRRSWTWTALISVPRGSTRRRDGTPPHVPSCKLRRPSPNMVRRHGRRRHPSAPQLRRSCPSLLVPFKKPYAPVPMPLASTCDTQRGRAGASPCRARSRRTWVIARRCSTHRPLWRSAVSELASGVLRHMPAQREFPIGRAQAAGGPRGAPRFREGRVHCSEYSGFANAQRYT